MTVLLSYAKGQEPVPITDPDALDAELDRVVAEVASADAPPLIALEATRGARTLLVGLRGPLGVLNYVDLDSGEGGFVSRGANPAAETPPYVYFGSWTGFEDNAEIPAEQVRAAAREFLLTGNRPTCVQWQD